MKKINKNRRLLLKLILLTGIFFLFKDIFALFGEEKEEFKIGRFRIYEKENRLVIIDKMGNRFILTNDGSIIVE